MNVNRHPIRTEPRRAPLRSMVSALALGCSLAAAGTAVCGEAGVACQKSYENGWQSTLHYAWNNCSGFKNEIGNVQFYYNLAGAEPYWETTWDQ